MNSNETEDYSFHAVLISYICFYINRIWHCQSLFAMLYTSFVYLFDDTPQQQWGLLYIQTDNTTFAEIASE